MHSQSTEWLDHPGLETGSCEHIQCTCTCSNKKLLLKQSALLLGRAWASPTLIMRTAPWEQHIDHENRIMVCLYHLPRVCRTLVPEIHVRPEMLHVFRYSGGHVRDLLCTPPEIFYLWLHWTPRMAADSAYWDSGAVAAQQLANAPAKTTDGLNVLLLCDVHIDKAQH